MGGAVIGAVVLVVWLGFSLLVGFDRARENAGRFEAIGHEGTYGRMFLGFWAWPRTWGCDFAFRVTFWPNRGAWSHVSYGPMFRRRGLRFGHRRFEYERRCELTGIKAGGWDRDGCCSICELGPGLVTQTQLTHEASAPQRKPTQRNGPHF